MNTKPIRVAQFGIGPIGAETLRLLLEKPWVELVAAVDIDPAKVGRDVGEVVGLGRTVGLAVTSTLEQTPQVVCHTTSSRLEQVERQILDLVSHGCHVVSTCEELAFPLDQRIRETFQKAAHAANVTVLGTGVNPGFVMDKLALTLTSACQSVDSVHSWRTVDASKRREPLQRKVGAGMTPEQFASAAGAGKIKHMGLRESLHMLADGLGSHMESESDEMIEPVIADREIRTDFLTVPKGAVAGVHQTISGKTKSGIELGLDLKMYVGADHPEDRVIVKGVPDLTMAIDGGVHGDRATAAMVVNSIPRVVTARPGVLTMDDIPISFR